MGKDKKSKRSRRDFLKLGIGVGATGLIAATAGGKLLSEMSNEANAETGESIKVLTTDGKLIEVDKSVIISKKDEFINVLQSYEGIPDRKFVMVIDLAKCKNARKCIKACQEGHHLTPDKEWIKVYMMQDSDQTAPYWFPRPCFHCDNPMCVSVCPVGATYKRSDGIVLVDTDRCIGCKFCMTGCPYSVRVFNWDAPPDEHDPTPYSPEKGYPQKEGTVGKCIFCPDKLRKGELPRCAAACPENVIYFGDLGEDTVTNGSETVRFSDLIRDRGGYRKFEELGTEPNVYYLPPVNRPNTIESGLDGLDEQIKDRYKNVPYIKNKKQ